MKLDFGEVLTRAWQITWRHKVLWALILLPMLLPLILSPLLIAPVFFLEENTSEPAETALVIAMLVFIVVFVVTSFIVNTISLSSATLGVIRADRGEGSLSFIDLLRDSTLYFGRILGVMLIISLSIGLLFTLFFLCVAALSIVTMGLASICLQPVMILLTPLMFLMVAVMEGAETAVIAEDAGAMDAVKRALQAVRAHIWKYIIITLIIYFGSTVLSSFIMTPFFIPVFAVPFLMETDAGSSPEVMIAVFIAFSCIFFPLMLAVQGIVGAFMKVSLDLTYLRLTRPVETEVIFQDGSA